MTDDVRLQRVVGYHDRTKHHPQRYARGPGRLDWANQPDPFRTYAGCRRVRLPIPPDAPGPTYRQIVAGPQPQVQPLSVESVSRWLYLSLAISAWKQYGPNRWALRCNPSSGNLHPTEGYLVLPAMRDLADAPGVYHYCPKDHALEQRAVLRAEDWSRLLPDATGGVLLVGLTSILWREAWKYGERAFRYCQLDIGHALGALRCAAATLGWRLAVWTDPTDDQIARLLGVGSDADGGQPPPAGKTSPVASDRGVQRDDSGTGRAGQGRPTLRVRSIPLTPHDPEPELPEPLAIVWPADRPPPRRSGADALDALASGAKWHGTPNRLSRTHAHWEIIDVVAEATRRTAHTDRPATPEARTEPPAASNAKREGQPPSAGNRAQPPPAPRDDEPAARIIRTRRSALAMDGHTGMSLPAFERLCRRVLPADPVSRVPLDALPTTPAVHLVWFVHCVEGLDPGLYLLIRRPEAEPLLRDAIRAGFDWQPVAPLSPLPLLCLRRCDCRKAAALLSLGQDIAGESAVAAAMLAEFEPRLREHGPWAYRLLHWEAGLIGQTLYLEAEALGLRATGIGAFFDDWVHTTLGIADHRIQDIYHFTIGSAIEDKRLTTLPAYA